MSARFWHQIRIERTRLSVRAWRAILAVRFEVEGIPKQIRRKAAMLTKRPRTEAQPGHDHV